MDYTSYSLQLLKTFVETLRFEELLSFISYSSIFLLYLIIVELIFM